MRCEKSVKTAEKIKTEFFLSKYRLQNKITALTAFSARYQFSKGTELLSRSQAILATDPDIFFRTSCSNESQAYFK